MATWTQVELMIRRLQFIRKRQKLLLSQRVMVMSGARDISRNMGAHGSITWKIMTRVICFNYITIATTPLPNQ